MRALRVIWKRSRKYCILQYNNASLFEAQNFLDIGFFLGTKLLQYSLASSGAASTTGVNRIVTKETPHV